MDILLHTIALEPARWTPQRVSKPLTELLPRIAEAGLYELEIFEPHLTLAADESLLVRQMAALRLVPVILSSYLDLSPTINSEEMFALQVEILLARVARFGFRKVRLFPGRSPITGRRAEVIKHTIRRLVAIADAQKDVEFLVETHDGSLADDAALLAQLIEACERPNIGLLWQPTVFEPEAAHAQLKVQKSLIRHFHLQNRAPDGRFVSLERGVIPWARFLESVSFRVGASVEFVPVAICSLEQFDLDVTLKEVAAEVAYINRLAVPK